jgi:hypothetical protein
MARKWWEVLAVCVSLLILAIVSTYPLILHFDTGIPYAPFGGVTVWNRSGDQIQLMYWFWLVKENFLGHVVPFDSNPFEFNMVVPYETSGLNTIPLAFLFMLFSPLGDIFAYNSTIISSYLLSGVFMYLLVQLYSGSRVGALLAALIFTFAPSRINGFAAGHGYGFLYFCYPFILYFLEKGIQSRKVRYGVLSSIGLIGLSMLEPHLIYYICVFLGMYIPVRVIALMPESMDRQVSAQQESRSKRISLFCILGAGVAVTVYSQLFFSVKDHVTFFTPTLRWILVLYPFLFLIVSLFLSTLYQRLTDLSFQESLWIEAKSLMVLYLFWPLNLLHDDDPVIHTDFLVFGSLAIVVLLKLWFLRRQLYSMLSVFLKGIVAQRKAVLPILPLVLSMAGIVKWMASSKVERVAETIAEGGRTLVDVGLFSAHINDLFSSVSNVYIGVVPALFCGGFLFYILLVSWFGKKRQVFSGEKELLPLFYMVVVLFCLVLALGLAFGNVSLYALFFHYFPFFHYPRVSDRIITLALFGLAIVCGYVVKNIQQRYQGGLRLTFITCILFAAMGFQLKDYNVFSPMGINILDKGQDVYRYVKENIGDGRLLEVPLWPGDSHQSSLYQHYIMLDGIPRINGCSPMVLKEYIDTVFTPLASINQGRLDEKQFELLHKLRVKYVTVHDNRDVFLKKVSPFTPLATVRRLENSPYFERVNIANKMYFKTMTKESGRLVLFRVKSRESVEKNSAQAWYDMPYFYDVNWRLHQQIGEVVQDSSIGKNIFQATEGLDNPGFLVYGPYDNYSPGDYHCTFSLSAEGKTGETLARIEVVAVHDNGDVSVLVEQPISGAVQGTGYLAYPLSYSIQKETKLEFRVFFHGKGQVKVEKIKVNKVGEYQTLYIVEAENMVGDTGTVVAVPEASAGKVVEAVVGKNKSDVLAYGPNRSYAEGSYTARFFLRNIGELPPEGKKNVVTELSVTDGQGLLTYAKQKIDASRLNSVSFSPIDLPFALSRADDLSFRVVFSGTGSLQLDKIEILVQ